MIEWLWTHFGASLVVVVMLLFAVWVGRDS